MNKAEEVVSKARASFVSGRTKNVNWRRNQLQQLYKMVTENENQFIEAERKDMRKPGFETVLNEISIIRTEAAHAMNNLIDWMKPTYPSKTLLQAVDTVYYKPEPRGVVLIIGPWNYPIHLLLVPLASAIAAGNCAVIKPSDLAEHTAEALKNLVPKYLDSECFPVYCCGVPGTTELLKERFDHIFFTGNKTVGKIIMAAAAKHLTPVTLELGGKSPVYVHKSSDVKLAAARVAWARLVNAGQTCLAPDYIVCDSEIKEDFVRCLGEVITDRYGEDPQESNDLTRIINATRFNTLKDMLDKTEKEKIVFGGKMDEDDLYIAPTIIDNCTLDDAMMSDEIFGPIFPILTVNDKEQAVATINQLDKPLALYVFSNENRVVDYVLRNTLSGGVTVNDALLHVANTNLPFGGVGPSGFGSYHGKHGFDEFSHYRSVCYRKQNMEFLVASRYPPYTEKNLKRSKFLLEEKPRRSCVIL